MAASHSDAERDGVVVPLTMEEYCMKAKPPQSPQVNLTQIWFINYVTISRWWDREIVDNSTKA